MYKYNCIDRPVRFIDPSVNPWQLAMHPSSEIRTLCAESKPAWISSPSNPREFAVRASISRMPLYVLLSYILCLITLITLLGANIYSTAFCEAYIYDGPQNQVYDFRETYKRSSVLNKTKKMLGSGQQLQEIGTDYRSGSLMVSWWPSGSELSQKPAIKAPNISV